MKKHGLSVERAAQLLGCTGQFIRVGLQQKRFSWGEAVKTSANRYTYLIYPEKFAEVTGINLEGIVSNERYAVKGE